MRAPSPAARRRGLNAPGMSGDLISQADFAKEIGVSKQAVSKAISVGRLPVYDVTGLPAGADYKGRKFLRLEEARTKFELSRARIDDATIADASNALERELDPEAPDPAPAPAVVDAPTRSLVEAKTSKEDLQAQILRMRIAKERGDLVSKHAMLDALETAGRQVQRAILQITSWAEELNGIAHEGGVPALTAHLRSKSTALAGTLADGLAAAAAGEIEEHDTGADAA